MKLGITINTYQRTDGTTPEFLKRVLRCIIDQTFQNFHVFLIGDKYEDEIEFYNIANHFPELKGKIYAENLPSAPEREKYLNIDNHALWSCGGITALNYANKIAKQKGFSKVCHIDHDDFWQPNHLELIAKAIIKKDSPAFIYTLAKFMQHPAFPVMEVNCEIMESYPTACNLVHSSVYMDLDQLPLQYRDVFAMENRHFPSDADMWERVRHYCMEYGLKSYVIKEVTCIHELENH